MTSVLTPLHGSSSALLYPPTPASLTPHSAPRGGILLNASRRSSYSASPLSTPMNRTVDLPRSNSASSSSDERSDKSAPRRIRFAPLPDPRRAVLVTDDGELIPVDPDNLSQPLASTSTATTPTTALSFASTPADSSALDADDSPPLNPLVPAGSRNASLLDVSASSESPSDIPQSSKKRVSRWGKRLGSLLKGGSSSGNNDKDDAQLYRATSRDSVQSASSTTAGDQFGFPLGRRKSTGSAAFDNSLRGAPLTKIRSADGSASAYRGQRMLNGRVYGAPRHQYPQASRTVEEPAFVEWGFGGMGSANAESSPYTSLQSNQKISVGADGEATNTEDLDDGSGMAWVRRRREQRRKAQEEKERQEAEEKAAAETAAKEAATTDEAHDKAPESATAPAPASPTSHIAPDTDDAETRPQTPTAASYNKSHAQPDPQAPSRRSVDTVHAAEPSQPLPPIASPGDSTTSASSAVSSTQHQEHHIVKAVNIPVVNRTHHHHQPRHSVSSLKDIIPSGHPGQSSATSESGSATDDEEEEEEEEDRDPAEDSESEAEEEEEEDEMTEDNRKTATSAGVEKVSRHT